VYIKLLLSQLAASEWPLLQSGCFSANTFRFCNANRLANIL